MAFFRNKDTSKQKKNNRSNGYSQNRKPVREKGNTASYVLMKIEQCISVAASASNMKVVTDKLYEASGFIAELAELEKKGLYKGSPKAADYIKSFVNRKDVILMEAIDRSLAAGQSKEEILSCQKFLTDEMKEYIQNQ